MSVSGAARALLHSSPSIGDSEEKASCVGVERDYLQSYALKTEIKRLQALWDLGDQNWRKMVLLDVALLEDFGNY